ncbi:hypothetical protein QYM36_013678 [Artemia franciscana]|uniref:Endonuclease/exonuclease/phosphatase domain-containing protein n=1 Tax=Artemia franciscana TaxID=6661 RepID=A0AA88HN49_ARTSF|nr:hypothetical protein QYM36_013678 [Artemia franciscana]
MHNYDLNILALSEIRWTGVGKQHLDKGYTILHSGLENKKVAGVTIMLSKTASKPLTNWTPINERIITTRFAGNNAKLVVVACYSPTNDADDAVKDTFYNTLQAVTKDIPSHEKNFFVGDLNAKEENDRFYCTDVLGKARVRVAISFERASDASVKRDETGGNPESRKTVLSMCAGQKRF